MSNINELQNVILDERADEIRDKTVALKGFVRNSIATAWEIGDLLLKAKAVVPHGSWSGWIEYNTTMTVSTASQYTRLRKRHTTVEKALFFDTIEDAALGYDKKAKERELQSVALKIAAATDTPIVADSPTASPIEDTRACIDNRYMDMERLGIFPLTARTLACITPVLREEYGTMYFNSIDKLKDLV